MWTCQFFAAACVADGACMGKCPETQSFEEAPELPLEPSASLSGPSSPYLVALVERLSLGMCAHVSVHLLVWCASFPWKGTTWAKKYL